MENNDEQVLTITKEKLDELYEALEKNYVGLEAVIDHISKEYNLSEGEQEIYNVLRRFIANYADIFYNFLSGKSVYTSTDRDAPTD